jgi:hypothetical protein
MRLGRQENLDGIIPAPLARHLQQFNQRPHQSFVVGYGSPQM